MVWTLNGVLEPNIYVVGLSDLGVDTIQNPDPIANGFPPVDERFLAPCMKNSSDRACTSAGM